MPVREVLQLGNPLLREKCSLVEDLRSPSIAALKTDLRDILHHWREATGYGRGIAAPQVGVLKRIVLIDMGTPWLLVNPEIVEASRELMEVYDACLSYLCIFFKVSRFKRIKMRYQDDNGEEKSVEAEDDLSELLQHEIDHLEGVLAIDRVTNIKSICTRAEFERRYKR